MNRESLKELGLTEEQIEKVMSEHGKVVNSNKNKVEALTSERDDLKEQVSTRDTQLNDLKKSAGDNEELKNEIERLKEENVETTKQMQEKLDSQSFSFALKEALATAKAKNPKTVMALLDVDQIKLDGDKLLGLDAQLEKIKKEEEYLFESEEQGSLHGRSPNTPGDKGSGKTNPFAKDTFNLTEQGRLFREDPEQYKLLKAQA